MSEKIWKQVHILNPPPARSITVCEISSFTQDDHFNCFTLAKFDCHVHMFREFWIFEGSTFLEIYDFFEGPNFCGILNWKMEQTMSQIYRFLIIPLLILFLRRGEYNIISWERLASSTLGREVVGKWSSGKDVIFI